MKKSRHSEEKVIAAVKQMEGGRKAADVARSMIKKWPGNPWPLYYAGCTLRATKNVDEALAAFQQSFKVGESLPGISAYDLNALRWDVASTLAEMYEHLHNKTEAIKWWRKITDGLGDERNQKYVADHIKKLSAG